jgi:hypothetical protein
LKARKPAQAHTSERTPSHFLLVSIFIPAPNNHQDYLRSLVFSISHEPTVRTIDTAGPPTTACHIGGPGKNAHKIHTNKPKLMAAQGNLRGCVEPSALEGAPTMPDLPGPCIFRMARTGLSIVPNEWNGNLFRSKGSTAKPEGKSFAERENGKSGTKRIGPAAP